MSSIATVELIYVAHSGRQYRAKHVQVHTGWELEDLEQKAKSDLSLRDYAIQFVNVNGHKQFIMPTDLETIIVNVVAVTEERWEEPDYEALQQKWNQNVKPYGESPAETTQETPAPPNPAQARATGQALQAVKERVRPVVSPVAPVTPDGETTQSIKITWPTAPKPQQRVQWPDNDTEKTQPISTIPGEVVGMSTEDATAVIERIAAGGAVTPGKG
ncbi:hypothetical protein SEA_WENTWORTH_49 [Streptomyces phage Wentworth]|jgi:hypothetical protein|nr:hypothetical protein SEA_WENTWORTH_49 [Streptomyces phage Wentworth]